MTWLNRGICYPLLNNYTCQCLGTNSYSGRYCQIISRQMIIYQIISKSFASLAIIIIISTILFIVLMDIFKYYFNNNPIDQELQQIRRKKMKTKVHPPVIIKFVYVPAPSIQETTL